MGIGGFEGGLGDGGLEEEVRRGEVGFWGWGWDCVRGDV